MIFNADGIADIIVGAIGSEGGLNGGAYIIYGGSNLSDGTTAEQLERGGTHFEGRLAGESVAGLGDVNGDDIDDVAFTDGESTYVLYGNKNPSELQLDDLSPTAGFRVDVSTYISFGDFVPYELSSVAAPGDVNGDGLNDVFIGAPRASTSGFFGAGAAYVVFGSSQPVTSPMTAADLDGTNGFTIENNGPSESRFARIANAAGDFNGDGFHDLVVGADVRAPFKNWLIFGKPSFASKIRTTEIPAGDGLAFETDQPSTDRIDAAGDINGDGIDDLIVNRSTVLFGRPNLDPAEIIGSSELIDTVDIAPGEKVTYVVTGLPSVVTDEPLGFEASASFAGDTVSSNNISSATTTIRRNVDVAVEAEMLDAIEEDTIRISATVTNQGRLTATDSIIQSNLSEFFSEATWTRTTKTLANPIVETTSPNGISFGQVDVDIRSRSGRGANPIGDVNGDGFDDLLNGQMLFLGGQNETLETIDLQSNLPGFTDGFGAGDINGDGYADIILSSTGSSYLVFGTPVLEDIDLNDPADAIRLTEQSIFSIGDRDADGFDDLLLMDEDFQRRDHKIVYGSALFDLQTAPVTKILNLVGFNSVLRNAAGNAGDLDGDGYDDAFIETSFGLGGRVRLLPGGVARPASINFEILPIIGSGGGEGDVVGAGDLNGDGFEDLAIAFDGVDSSDFPVGRLQLVFGAGDISNLPGTSLELGLSGGRLVDTKLDFAGDLNGDGFDDIVLANRSVIFGATEISKASGSLESQVHFEYRISTRDAPRIGGDINGDGFGDYLLDEYVKFAEFETGLLFGIGDIRDTVDIGIGTQVNYQITGSPTSTTRDFQLAATVDSVWADEQPANNVARLQLDVPVLQGDFNGDLWVNFTDFLILTENFGRMNRSSAQGDIDGNGTVDFVDFLIFSENFGRRIG